MAKKKAAVVKKAPAFKKMICVQWQDDGDEESEFYETVVGTPDEPQNLAVNEGDEVAVYVFSHVAVYRSTARLERK